MYFTQNIQIFTSICTDNNSFIGCANGCIWKKSKKKSEMKFQLQMHEDRKKKKKVSDTWIEFLLR